MSTSHVETHSDASPSPTSIRGSRRTWTITGLLVLLYMINAADKSVMGIIAQPLSEELDLTAAQIGLVGSLFYIPFVLGGLLTGTITRFATLKWALVALSLAWALAMLPVVLAAGFAVLLISRMFLGFAEGPSAALIYTATYSWHAPEKRGFPGALIAAAPSFAGVLLIPVLSYLAVSHGWRAALIALAGAGVVWVILWLPIWSPGPHVDSQSKEADTHTSEDKTAVPWTRIFINSTFIALALVAMCIGILGAIVMAWLPSYLELGLGFSRLNAGSMVAVPAGFGLVVMLLVAKLSDRLTLRGKSSRLTRAVLPSAGVLTGGLFLALLPFNSNPALGVALIAVGFAFISTGLPLLVAGVSEICPPKQIPGMLGVFTATYGLGGLVGPFATGLIVDAAASPGDGYATAYQVFGLVAAVVAAGAIVVADPNRDRVRTRSDADDGEDLNIA